MWRETRAAIAGILELMGKGLYVIELWMKIEIPPDGSVLLGVAGLLRWRYGRMLILVGSINFVSCRQIIWGRNLWMRIWRSGKFARRLRQFHWSIEYISCAIVLVVMGLLVCFGLKAIWLTIG